MASAGGNLLMSVNFPVFVVKSLGSKYFILGGGGGPSATGVPNGLEIIELVLEQDNSSKLIAKTVCKHDSKTYAIMHCGLAADSLRRLLLACGQDDKCNIYTLDQRTVTPRPNSPDGQLRKRKSGLTKADDFKNARKVVTFNINLVDSMKTDFHATDPYQSCVAFSSDRSQIATGGADGSVRLWSYPDISKVWEVKAHELEVDAIQINPNGEQLCSTSRDGKLLLWKLSSGEKVAELKWNSDPPVKCRHKDFRYCMVEGDSKKTCLFSIEVPVVAGKGPCFISQWNINSHKPICVHTIKKTNLSTMEVSDCGLYVAVGGMEGEVSVYSTLNFQTLYHTRGAHKTFTTGLAFAPSDLSTKSLCLNAQFTLISVSIDNQVKVHQAPKAGWKKTKFFILLVCMLISAMLTIFGAAALPYYRSNST